MPVPASSTMGHRKERGQFVMLQVGEDRQGCKNSCLMELDFLPSCLRYNSTQEICFVL